MSQSLFSCGIISRPLLRATVVEVGFPCISYTFDYPFYSLSAIHLTRDRSAAEYVPFTSADHTRGRHYFSLP
jgi:hypothetical protein